MCATEQLCTWASARGAKLAFAPPGKFGLRTKLLLCTEDDNSCYRNGCKMSVVSFALAVVFIIRLFSTSAFRVPKFLFFCLNYTNVSLSDKHTTQLH